MARNSAAENSKQKDKEINPSIDSGQVEPRRIPLIAGTMGQVKFMGKEENNYAFIDSQNLNLGVRSQGWNLDFARFRQFLKDKYGVGKTYLFIGFVPGNQTLYTELQKAGYLRKN
ncbi:MAG: hypothetical protein COU42_01165 [Candidatus Nealsonbacteria bacterium CG10_big_fil_rev_8_21_14_0_10_36_24]|uniref:NYN domain-containing protein n=1 Tax=Candidatus Nealsonbacteria bacterium CG10_big_fil_rev_8_21_14_0_10_36_24 TaxID=1974710 RepID=A0A2M6NSA5_9BACT|nr:MAG: hypothetical protein COU42_01165 [Candidatus Nealsonbacteria bacterium CG10_big_fil_rev_8_21_14_0_10_36_24]